MGGNGVYLGVGIGCVFPIIIGNYREIIEDLSETIGKLSEICWLEMCEKWCEMVCGEVCERCHEFWRGDMIFGVAM